MVKSTCELNMSTPSRAMALANGSVRSGELTDNAKCDGLWGIEVIGVICKEPVLGRASFPRDGQRADVAIKQPDVECVGHD